MKPLCTCDPDDASTFDTEENLDGWVLCTICGGQR